MSGLYKEIVEDGKMHLSARRGVLSLLEKLDKNPLTLTSWRPLTLLNTDNKLYGKVLANRLQIALKKLTHHSQNSFIKGRNILENLIKIAEVISKCETTGTNGLLISFDFLKAFNMVEFDALLYSLAAFGFGSHYIDMVATLFTEPIIYASNNGFWSDPIHPTRGCRQGCTFSPGIFALTVKLLGIAIRQNKKIIGIKLRNQIIKSGQFADELWIVTPPSQESVNKTLSELTKFQHYSGLRINLKNQ